ncbi:MAG: hypothetical protein ABR511_13290 [Acidimicrobiales bacterium]
MTDEVQAGEVDDALVGALRELAGRIDPEPPELASAAVAAFSWRTIDDDLARLTYDSLLDDDRLVGVRGDGGPRQLTFEGHGLNVEVEVGEGRSLVGQLVPPRAADVEVRWPGGTTSVMADDLGRFSLVGAPAGPVSLRCRLRGDPGRSVQTDWVVV